MCVYIYIMCMWELVQCRTGPLELSVAAFFLWQGFELLSEKGNTNVLVFCCFVVCVGFFSCFFLLVLFFFFNPSVLYCMCPEAQRERKIVLTLKTCLCNAAEKI